MDRTTDWTGWRDLIVSTLTEYGERLAERLPDVVVAVVILAVGWAIARIVQAACRRGLRRIGLDRGAERLAGAQAAGPGTPRRPPSELVARWVFWVLMLTFGLTAAESLGSDAAAVAVDRIAAFVPNLLAASLILVGGLLLGRLTRQATTSGATAARVDNAERFGAAAQLAVVGMTAVLALGQVGIDTAALMMLLMAIVLTVGLTAGLGLSLGARGVIGHILAGHYLRTSLPPGRRVEVLGRAGVVDHVGPVSTSFRVGDRTWSIPNAKLLEETVES